MPYHIESSTGEYKIVDDAGKVHGTHPTRKQAVAQLQALYASVPDSKEITPFSIEFRESGIVSVKERSDIFDLIDTSDKGASPNLVFLSHNIDVSDIPQQSKAIGIPQNSIVVSDKFKSLLDSDNTAISITIKPSSNEMRNEIVRNLRLDKVITFSFDNSPLPHGVKETIISSGDLNGRGLFSALNFSSGKSNSSGKILNVSNVLVSDNDVKSGSILLSRDTSVSKNKSRPISDSGGLSTKEIPVPIIDDSSVPHFVKVVCLNQEDSNLVPLAMVLGRKSVKVESVVDSIVNDGGIFFGGKHDHIITQGSQMFNSELKASSKDPGDYLIVEDREMPTTWHLQVRTNGTPDHRLMGAAWAALHEGYRGNTYEGPNKGEALSKLKKLYESEKMDTPATKEAQAPQPSIIDRVIAMFTRDKEGRRNSSPDGDRLQQIHDLAVLNGASCPMVMKEADGKLRWVLLSSNAFMDSDKEIISRKALEDDVARTDKEQAPYGPLRWWHMGAPDPISLHAGSGADIGDCDYRAMSGRVLIESGTFRNEQIGAAVKERADTLAGSIGFFHPKDEPDNEGVYRNIVQFERSLLPRGKASNMLTALTVKGWEDMATSKEKQDALAALLGDQSLAESVIKQAEIVEKQADDRGLKYKEETAEKSLSGTPTAVPATGASGINPIGLAKDDKAKQAEGEPGEEKTEPKKEAAAEPDWEALMKGLGPHISKMIEEKMKANAKEASEKEAGLKATIDQIAADVKELKGDIPRGLQGGFRASLSDMTIIPNINTKSAPEVGSLDSVIDQLMGLKK